MGFCSTACVQRHLLACLPQPGLALQVLMPDLHRASAYGRQPLLQLCHPLARLTQALAQLQQLQRPPLLQLLQANQKSSKTPTLLQILIEA